MRGGQFSQGHTLQGIRMPQTDWTNNRLFNSAMAITSMPADEYNFWNRRETLQTTMVQQQSVPYIHVPRKISPPHIARIARGGWGHVPASDSARVEALQNLERLRGGVKQRC
ncbi:MAG: hypothetical protein DDT42_01112 [candidate division WS2 bacterium]|uniref:Uncharacterized protein n=1 Tax=Psychracetigena formicireducens TaxID=2986056 RepID=A0A9E2F223_PSYF1|nr:hypothetical protein [Candidatus Psychracetigena formicireducens]